MKDLELDANYIKNITEKVENSLTMIDKIISGDLTARPIMKTLSGKDALNMSFKVLAGTGLAATVVNPIIGIAIMFLSEIIKTISGRMRDPYKEKQIEEI